MKRLICLILCICLLVGMTGCVSPKQDSLRIPETTESSGATETTGATEPPQMVYPFEYTLTDGDVEEFYRLLEESEQIALDGTDLEKVDEITDQLTAQVELLEDQTTIAQINYYCDMSDEAASQRYLDCVDIVSDASNDYIEMVRRVYQSESPAKEVLFEGWTQEELDMLLAYSDEIAALEKRNSEILVEYQALEDPASDEMVPLYLEQVQNNNRIAQIYGYSNYYEYAYEVVYGRDYDSTQLEKMRQYAAQHLAGIYEDAYYAFYDAYDALGFVDQMKLSAFMTDAYDDCGKDYLTAYLKKLPQEVGDSMLDAIDSGNAYFTDSENAYSGAFTTVVGEESFCFFGPDYANTLTVVHELGHYYGSQFGDLDMLPLDLAETQSQGNEWLFMGMLTEAVDEELYDALLNYKMYSDLGTILICILVDEFEQQIYSTADPRSLTADDCSRIMAQICESYGGIDYISCWITDVYSYWRYVVVESPVYYISYGVSAIAAMNLYTLYQEDPDAAIAAYRAVTEGDGEEKGFLETIQAAKLPGPFDEAVYEDLAKFYSE